MISSISSTLLNFLYATALITVIVFSCSKVFGKQGIIMEEKTKSDRMRTPFDIFGIHFAPLLMPLERRLQTAAVLQFVFTFLLGGFGCLLLSGFLLFTPAYFAILLYYAWMYYDRKTPELGSRPSKWMRNWPIWNWMANFFPVKLHKTVDLPTEKNYLACFHPHGILAFGAASNFATEGTGFSKKFPGIRSLLVVLKGHFSFPFYRDYISRMGLVASSKRSLRYLLDKENGVGRFVVLLVGGAREALSARPGQYLLVLKSRKGFIRIAMESGASLVPVFSFGEVDMYEQSDNAPGSFLRRLQDFLLPYTGFSMPLFRGRGVFNYSFGLLPYRRPINTVVGTPIDVPKVENPTDVEVNELHERYLRALTDLFESNKLKFGLKETDHLIIE